MNADVVVHFLEAWKERFSAIVRAFLDSVVDAEDVWSATVHELFPIRLLMRGDLRTRAAYLGAIDRELERGGFS